MAGKLQKWATLEDVPCVSQNLRLKCSRCGKQAVYNVGTVFHEQEGEGESRKHHFAFTNYFRCRHCESAGPWEVADFIKLLGLTLRARVSKDFDGLYGGRLALFDGTFIQSPAQGEEHLRKLLANDPNNGFLCSRLGNLLRSCNLADRAVEWYRKAVWLDPADIESRHALYVYAVKAGDLPEAVLHARRLVRDLLDGREAETPKLTEALAVALVESLRGSPEEFRQCFSEDSAKTPHAPDAIFIQSLLDAEGDKDEIIDDAVERVLDGEIEITTNPMTTNRTSKNLEPPVDLIASLEKVVSAEELKAEKLHPAIATDEKGSKICIQDRHSIPLHDDRKTAVWQAPSLREMFRGNRMPPSDSDMNRYPPEYCVFFYFVEESALTLCDVIGDRTDQEMEEVYAMLRRRPDGKSLGPAHDFLWQVAALLLGKYALSQAEFEAIFGQLARSARHWRQPPVSRNYLGYLRNTFRGERPQRLN